jgi:molybdopterin synthase catalytic subunit
VRDLSENKAVTQMTLEHYPGMTEKSLEAIVDQAKNRWDVMDAMIIHRVGTLATCDQIVLVAVCGAHRSEAFLACEFMMDYLKTDAPFWKKEVTQTGEHWVEAKVTDDNARARWASSTKI